MLWDESADLLKIQHNTSPTLTISDASGNGYINFEHSGLTPTLRAQFSAKDDGAYGKDFVWTTHSVAGNSGSQVERMRLMRAGKLGIGTDNPTHTLDVRGTGAFNNTLHITGNSYLQFTGGVYFSLQTKNSDNDICWTSAASGGGIRWYLASDGKLGFDHNTNRIGHANFVGEVGAGMKAISFQRTNGGAEAGYIVTSGTTTTQYVTTSDYRFKENVNYDWDATTRLKQLKPARFNWIEDETNTLQDGFLAHELSSIVPEAVAGEKDAMTAPLLYEDSHEIPAGKSVGDVRVPSRISPQGVDTSKLVPLLVKAVQELSARLDATANMADLEQRIQEIEQRLL